MWLDSSKGLVPAQPFDTQYIISAVQLVDPARFAYLRPCGACRSVLVNTEWWLSPLFERRRSCIVLARLSCLHEHLYCGRPGSLHLSRVQITSPCVCALSMWLRVGVLSGSAHNSWPSFVGHTLAPHMYIQYCGCAPQWRQAGAANNSWRLLYAAVGARGGGVSLSTLSIDRSFPNLLSAEDPN